MAIPLSSLKRISDYEWEIPVSFNQYMRVPVRFFATHKILESIADDLSLTQAVNAASLPGLVGNVVVMPDIHQGYGFPIGGIAASLYPQGVISPGGIGYDINCGVRLLASKIPLKTALPSLEELSLALDRYCPSGVGAKGGIRLNEEELKQLCRQGSRWALKKNAASEEDIRFTEDAGCLEGADPSCVSDRALKRGADQVGSLGAGNHFIEIDVVEQIFDEKSATAFGLEVDCLVLQIHSGSRGFGHQICTDYVQEFQSVVRRYKIEIVDRELVCAPLDSPEGQAYLAAQRCAANYAFVNRQFLAHQARKAFSQVFETRFKNHYLRQVYDLAHNIGKIEKHTVDGKLIKVCIHRKGATRSFGPNSPEIPEDFRQSGQPVLVPGSMGTSSWVLAGTDAAMDKSFGSACHGAGRLLSRQKSKRAVSGSDIRDNLEKQGIHIRAGSLAGLAEEAPSAYKNVDEIVDVVIGAGLARRVARLRPLVVVKG